MNRLLPLLIFICGAYTQLYAQGNIGIGESAPSTKLEIKGDGSDLLNVKDNTNDSKLYIDSDGNVGVGTTNPLGSLHIPDDMVTSNSSGVVRKYSSSISSTQSGLIKMGELTLGGSSNNVLITGKVHGQTGGSSGESNFSIMIRTNTFPGKTIKYWQLKTDAGINIDLKVYEETSTGRVVVGFEPNNTVQSFGWDITLMERGDYDYWVNENSYTALNTTGLTLVNQSANDYSIITGGNVGIGKVNPSAKLEVDGDLKLLNGTSINEFSTDGTLGGNSDNVIPTEQAVKTYIDAQVGGVTETDPTWSGTVNTTGNINRTGNVSIGTAVATRQLEVHDASDIIANFRRSNSNSVGISLEGSTNDITRIYGADKALRVFHTPNGGSSLEVFTIETNGNASVAGNLSVQSGTAISEFSTDGTLGGNSNNVLPTENAVKTYVDAQVSGVTETDPTWTGAANTSGSIGRTGSLGIGTSSPGAPLEVRSEILVNNTATRGDAVLEINRGTDGRDAGVVVYSNGSNIDWYAGIPYNCGGNTDQYTISSQDYINNCGGVTHTPEFLIDANGDVGIGVSNPTYKLHVNGRLKTNGINETSDMRFKKNIVTLENSLDIILQLRGVSYDWRKDEFPDMKFKEGKDLGVIAQEIEKVIPEVVATDDEGYKSVQYSHLVPVLIEALKEQQAIIENKNIEMQAMQESIKVLQADMKAVKEAQYMLVKK